MRHEPSITAQHRALGADRDARRLMVRAPRQLPRSAHRRRASRCRSRPAPGPAESGRDRGTAVIALARPEPVEPGDGQQRRIGHAVAQLAQPRIDIAAERHDLEVRPVPQHLRRPADRRGAEPRALRQVVDAASRSATRTRRARPRARGMPPAPARPAGPSPRPCSNARRVSIAPASSASSISLVNRPLPPISLRRPVGSRSPLVVMTSMAIAVVVDAVRLGQQPRDQSACASASGEPRVPIRRNGVSRLQSSSVLL